MLDDLLLKVASFGLTALALVIAYRTVPNRYVPTRHALIGGVVAALLFELVKHLFVAYIVRVPTYKLVYGAFASVPIFLLWLFCCWMVVLIGAEVAATLSYFGHPPALPSVRAQHPSMRLREATQLVDALASSPMPIAFNALRLRTSIPIDKAEDVMHDLLEARIVSRTENGCFVLASPRDTIGEQDLRDAMGAD